MPTLIQDPSWFPHHLNSQRETIDFVHLPRAAHRAVTFLSDEYFEPGMERRAVALRDVVPAVAALDAGICHFIFHSAFCGSTLLTRLLDIEGVAMGLKEPAGLNHVAGILYQSRRQADVKALLQTLLALYARPFGQGETVIVKPSNVANVVIDDVLAISPASRVLFLYSPLPAFLLSLASKGLFARIWARRLAANLMSVPEFNSGFSESERWLQTDLQVAALGWLQQQAQFARLTKIHGSRRIATIDSATLLADLAGGLTAMGGLFGLDRAALAAAAASPARFQDSKRHDRKFDAEMRVQEHETARRAYGEEIDKVTIWAEAVAKHCGVPMNLDARLLDRP